MSPLFLIVSLLSLNNFITAQNIYPFSTSNYKFNDTVQDSNNHTLELFWSIDSTNNQISVAVFSPNGRTWVGLGTSETGGMKGADIWLGRFDLSENKFVIEDRYAPTAGTPQKDDTQSLLQAQGGQTDAYTWFSFTRNLVSCDSQDITIAVDFPIWLIYAIGDSNNFAQHPTGNTGKKAIDLGKTYFSTDLVVKGATEEIVDLMSPEVEIPAHPTTYCYSYHEFTGPKRHIIQEIPVINSKFVHHLVGYLCDAPQTQFKDSKVLCNKLGSGEPRNYTNQCTRAYILWGLGASTRDYPMEAGKPIGVSALNTQYLILETHYNNPDKIAGQRDLGSGLQLLVTSNLRKNDIGVIFLGTNQEFIYIPKRQKSYTISSECPAKCTSKSIPSTGLTVLTYNIHMHQRGISGSTRHVRNDKELPPLAVMKNFDFHFQNYNYVPKTQAKILPGDRLITDCTWNTENDANFTLGGFQSNEEMCINFVEYYPAVSLHNCGQTGQIPSPLVPNLFICLSIGDDLEVSSNGTHNGFLTVAPTDFPVYQEYDSKVCAKSGVQKLHIDWVLIGLILSSFLLF